MSITQLHLAGRVRSVRKSIGLYTGERLCTFEPLIAACGCGPPGGESPAGDLQSR